jgi:hypothetical protein
MMLAVRSCGSTGGADDRAHQELHLLAQPSTPLWSERSIADLTCLSTIPFLRTYPYDQFIHMELCAFFARAIENPHHAAGICATHCVGLYLPVPGWVSICPFPAGCLSGSIHLADAFCKRSPAAWGGMQRLRAHRRCGVDGR